MYYISDFNRKKAPLQELFLKNKINNGMQIIIGALIYLTL